MPNEREQLIAGVFDAWNEGGAEAFIDHLVERAAMHPDFMMEIQRDAPNAGIWRGEDGFREMAGNWMEAWNQFEIHPQETVEVGPGQFLVPTRQRAVARGSGLEVKALYVYTFEFEGERVRRIGLFFDRPEAERFLTEGEG